MKITSKQMGLKAGFIFCMLVILLAGGCCVFGGCDRGGGGGGHHGGGVHRESGEGHKR